MSRSNYENWKGFNEEALTDSSVTRQGPMCKTCKLILSLHSEAAGELEKACTSPDVTSASIRRALLARVDARQIPSTYSISRHRRGDCRQVGGEAK